MKNNTMFFAIFSMVICLFSCCPFTTDCGDNSNDSVCTFSIRNNSSQPIQIVTYLQSTNEVINTIQLTPNENGVSCILVNNCTGYNPIQCGFDMLKITFPNGKGYICGVNTSNYLFSNNQSPMVKGEKHIEVSPNNFEFTITQEDYTNAHTLP